MKVTMTTDGLNLTLADNAGSIDVDEARIALCFINTSGRVELVCFDGYDIPQGYSFIELVTPEEDIESFLSYYSVTTIARIMESLEINEEGDYKTTAADVYYHIARNCKGFEEMVALNNMPHGVTAPRSFNKWLDKNHNRLVSINEGLDD